MSRWLLGVSLALLVASPAQASGRKHVALYRGAVGPGYVAAEEGDYGVHGVGLLGSFAVGWFVLDNLAMHVDSFGSFLVAPGVDGPEVEGAVDGSLAHAAIGVGVTYYFMPANLYFAPSVGTGLAWLSVGPATGSTKLGLAVNLLAGKEWFVGSDFGIGVALQAQTYVLPDTESLRSFGGGVLLSLSYCEGSRPAPIRYRFEERREEPAAAELPAAPAQPAEPMQEEPAAAMEAAAPVDPAATQVAEATVPVPASASQTRTITGRGYALDVPPAWVDVPSSGGEELLRVREPQLVSGTFMSVALTVEYFTGDSAALAARHAQHGGAVSEQQKVQVGGLPGVSLVRAGETLQQTVLEYVTADGGAGYALSCSLDTARFTAERATCERILQSFRFTKMH